MQKTIYRLFLLIVSLAALTLGAQPTTHRGEFETIRGTLSAQRTAVHVNNLGLTDSESEQFWPIYRNYRAAMDQVTDEVVELIFEYASVYPDVPDEKADAMLGKLLELEQARLNTRKEGIQKVGQVLTASKTLRFTQLELRMDSIAHAKLSERIPLVSGNAK